MAARIHFESKHTSIPSDNITGTGTINQVAKFTGANAIGDSIITDDGTNVGIGTISPLRLLSLYSNNSETTPRLLIEQDGTGDAIMAFKLTSGQGWSMGIDNSGADAFMIHNSDGGVDSSSQFTILTTGNVGIGTSSPSAKLELLGASPSDVFSGQLKLTGSETTGAIDTGGALAFSGSNGTGNSTWAYIRGMKENSIVSNNDSYLSFATRAAGGNPTEAMRINSTGNVGIGTTSPAAKLEVNGGIGVSTTGGTLVVRQKGDTSNDGISLTSSNAKSHRMYKNSSGVFLMGPSTDADAFAIDLAGNVGIGTSSPAYNLHVNGAGDSRIIITDSTQGSAASDGIYIRQSSVNSSIVNQENGTLQFGTNNSFAQTILANGNVGIGTSSPSVKLVVDGGSNIASFQSAGVGENLKKLNIGTGGDRVILNAATTTDATTAFAFETGATERMRIDSTGNVGIGTSSPATTLHVSAAAGALKVTSTSGGANVFLESISGNLSRLRWNGLDNFAIRDDAVSQDRFIINTLGNVGIGTSSPTSKLHVTGLLVFANNADALAGGLTSGAFYTNASGTLSAVL